MKPSFSSPCSTSISLPSVDCDVPSKGMKNNSSLSGLRHLLGPTVLRLISRRVLIVLAAINHIGMIRAQSSPTHGLNLITPSDPDFQSLLSMFPGLTSKPAYGSIAPYLVFLENQTNFEAKAYCVEWTVTSDKGVVSHQTKLFIQKHFMLGQARNVKTGALRLVSPYFSLTPEEYRNESQWQAFLNQPLPQFALRSVKANLDGVVHNDGVFVGPNHSHLLETYVALRHAEHDEGIVIQRLLQSRRSVAQITAQLNQDIQTGLASVQGKDTHSIYLKELGKQAEILKNLLQQSGIEALTQKVGRMADYPREHITNISN